MIWTVVVAAGSGTRFGGTKQYQSLAGKRVLDWSLEAARSVTDGVVLVVPPDRVNDAEPAADAVVAGGETRADSVRCGLVGVPDSAQVIVVHDAARPLATPQLFRQVVAELAGDGAEGAIPTVPVIDTIRSVSGGVVDRSELVAVQTPQAFDASALRAAHSSGAYATDDATLVEFNGGRVILVQGEATNLKITSPADLVAAEAVLAAR